MASTTIVDAPASFRARMRAHAVSARRAAVSLPQWGAAALAGAAALSAMVTLWWPLGWDQASFAQIGAAILDGAVPYRDAFEMRGPAALYLFAAIVAVFGRNAAGVRVFDVFMLGAAGVLFWRMLRSFVSRTAIVTAFALWALYTVSLGAHFTAQPDMWVGYAALAAVWLGARPPEARSECARLRDLVVAGALVAFCGLNKPFYFGYLAAVEAAVVAERGWRRAALVRPLLTLGAGCAVPVVIVLGVLAIMRALPAFVEAHVLFNLRVYRGVSAFSLPQLVRGVLEFVAYTPPVALAVSAAVAGFAVLVRRARPLAAGMAVLLAVGFVTLVLQRKLFLYHWFPLLIGIAFLAAAMPGVRDDAGVAPRRPAVPRSVDAFVVAYAAVLALTVSLRAATPVWRWARYVAGRTSAAEYYGAFGNEWDLNPADQMRMAAFLRAHTPPGAPVAVWGVDAAVPFLAHRPMVGRFPVTRLLTVNPTAPMMRAFRHEYADAVRAARPPYILYGLFVDRRNGLPSLPLSQLLPDLGPYFEQHYVYDGRLASFDVYRRADYRPPQR